MYQLKPSKILLTSIVLAIVCFGFSSCSSKKQDKENVSIPELRAEKEDRITLVNIGYGSRDYIATVIDKIATCSPKVVALDVFFLKPGEEEQDQHLASAIGSVPTVMAVEEYAEESYAESIPLFVNNAIAEGLIEEFANGEATIYKPFRTLRDSTGKRNTLGYLSVPIVQQYDLNLAKKFVRKVESDKDYYLNYLYSKDNFKVYEFEDTVFNCSDIQDKIVILGYLGPGKEDKFKTPVIDKATGENMEMYATVIIANQVAAMLEDSEVKAY